MTETRVLLVGVVVLLGGCLGQSPAPSPSNVSETEDGAKETPETGNATRNATWKVGDVVAEGTILVGSPTTYVRSLTVAAGQEGIDSFRMDEVPPPGSVIETNTTDGGGAGFNLDLYFHDSSGGYLGGCSDRPAPATAGEQSCEVPDDAAQGTVDAVWGVGLDVTVTVASVANGTA